MALLEDIAWQLQVRKLVFGDNLRDDQEFEVVDVFFQSISLGRFRRGQGKEIQPIRQFKFLASLLPKD